MVTTTVINGNNKITVNVSMGQKWEKSGNARQYYSVEHISKRIVIASLYEVLSGTTRDDTVLVNGRTFGYQLGMCDSHTKRDHAKAAVLRIAEQL